MEVSSLASKPGDILVPDINSYKAIPAAETKGRTSGEHNLSSAQSFPLLRAVTSSPPLSAPHEVINYSANIKREDGKEAPAKQSIKELYST